MNKKTIKIAIEVVLLLLTLGIVVWLITGIFHKKKKEPVIVTTATLEKIINVSELSTFQAVYNGIATVYNAENSDKIDYYVSYKAKVQAGIDFEKVEISKDDVEKKILVKIPQITLGEPMVEIESMDFIFKDKRKDKLTVSEEAYAECIRDAKQESEKEQAIYTLARQNAENVLKALISPFVEDMEESYEVVIE